MLWRFSAHPKKCTWNVRGYENSPTEVSVSLQVSHLVYRSSDPLILNRTCCPPQGHRCVWPEILLKTSDGPIDGDKRINLHFHANGYKNNTKYNFLQSSSVLLIGDSLEHLGCHLSIKRNRWVSSRKWWKTRVKNACQDMYY